MLWYLLIVYFFIATVSSSDVSHTQHHTAIDSFIQRLKLEKWEKEEAPCLEKTLTLLENVKNFTLWATWVWNANTIPTGNLYGATVNYGNFDQCMKPPWLETHPQFRTKYCLTRLELTNSPKKRAEYDPYGSTVEYLNSPTTSGLPVNNFVWGLCIPSTCDPPSVVKITRSMYDLTTFGSQTPNITVEHCQVAGEKPQPGVGFYLFIALIASLIIIAAASTYYRLHVASDDHPPDSLETVITKSFCVIKNRQDLTKVNRGEISVMNGMRVITAATVILIHQMFYITMSGVSDSRDYDKFLEGIGGYFLHYDVVVDTFFAMSGLLHIKGLLGNVSRQQNLFSVLWKRYIRLVGPFALMIFYLISVSKYVGSGPIWIYGNEQESEVCRKTWRLSLLMLNQDSKYLAHFFMDFHFITTAPKIVESCMNLNQKYELPYIERPVSEQWDYRLMMMMILLGILYMCHAVTWYVPCDYQLTILGTVLFYFFQKDRRLGFASFGIAAVLSVIIPGVLTYWFQIPAILFTDFARIVKDIRSYWEISYTYTPSYSRAGAYLVGVAMGYVMTVYKPSEYRRTVSMTWSIVGTAISLAVMLCIMALQVFFMHREYDPLEAAVVASTNRIAWAVAICVIIGLCEYGTVPLVREFLSLSFFTPLSRLSYGIYMIHPLIIQRDKLSLRSPEQFDWFSISLDIIATMTTSAALSFVMWLLVEAPLISMSNHFLFAKPKSKQLMEGSEKTGIHLQNADIKSKAA